MGKFNKKYAEPTNSEIFTEAVNFFGSKDLTTEQLEVFSRKKYGINMKHRIEKAGRPFVTGLRSLKDRILRRWKEQQMEASGERPMFLDIEPAGTGSSVPEASSIPPFEFSGMSMSNESEGSHHSGTSSSSVLGSVRSSQFKDENLNVPKKKKRKFDFHISVAGKRSSVPMPSSALSLEPNFEMDDISEEYFRKNLSSEGSSSATLGAGSSPKTVKFHKMGKDNFSPPLSSRRRRSGSRSSSHDSYGNISSDETGTLNNDYGVLDENSFVSESSARSQGNETDTSEQNFSSTAGRKRNKFMRALRNVFQSVHSPRSSRCSSTSTFSEDVSGSEQLSSPSSMQNIPENDSIGNVTQFVLAKVSPKLHFIKSTDSLVASTNDNSYPISNETQKEIDGRTIETKNKPITVENLFGFFHNARKNTNTPDGSTYDNIYGKPKETRMGIDHRAMKTKDEPMHADKIIASRENFNAEGKPFDTSRKRPWRKNSSESVTSDEQNGVMKRRKIFRNSSLDTDCRGDNGIITRFKKFMRPSTSSSVPELDSSELDETRRALENKGSRRKYIKYYNQTAKNSPKTPLMVNKKSSQNLYLHNKHENQDIDAKPVKTSSGKVRKTVSFCLEGDDSTTTNQTDSERTEIPSDRNISSETNDEDYIENLITQNDSSENTEVFSNSSENMVHQSSDTAEETDMFYTLKPSSDEEVVDEQNTPNHEELETSSETRNYSTCIIL